MPEDGSTAVLEPPASAAPPETASDDTPAPASSVSTGDTGQVGGAEGQDGGAQGPVGEQAASPEVSDQESLQAALDAREAFAQGKSDTLKLDQRQRDLLRSHDDRQESLRALEAKREEDYQAFIGKVNKRFAEAAPEVVGVLNDILTEIGVSIEPTSVQAKYAQDKLGTIFGSLRSDLAEIVVEPLADTERQNLLAILEQKGLLTPQRRREIRALPLVGTDPSKPSIASAYYWLGKMDGPDQNSRVTPKSEWEQKDGKWLHKDTAKAVHDTYKAQGIKGPVAGNGNQAQGSQSVHFNTKMEARDLHAKGLLTNDQMRAINRGDLPEM